MTPSSEPHVRIASIPAGFVWGAATSAYQIEGSPRADDAGATIWHRFSHTPGRVLNGDTGDVACDHYRRWESDVELMGELGLQSYRFSLGWARLFPEGRGRVNPKGVDFYARLIDRLLARGITPNVTLYHWDLPAALDDRGGWLNPDIVKWFADYTEAAFRAYGDRVPMWATLNEPWVVTDAGYLHGVYAPGHANLFEAPIATHHLLLAHAAAVQRYRAGGWPHQIGVVLNLEPKDPASDSPQDVAATARAHVYMNEQYMDALFFGRYPAELRAIFGEAWPEWPAEEMALLRTPFDFLGINYYTRALTREEPGRPPVFDARVTPPGAIIMNTGWEFYPKGLERIPGLGEGALRQRAAVHHRVWRHLRRPARDRGRRARSAARRHLPAEPARLPRGHRARRRPARLLRLVSAGQLRVELGVLEAIRRGARGFRNAGPNDQG